MNALLLSDNDVYRIIRDVFREKQERWRESDGSRIILPPDADFMNPEWALDSIQLLETASVVNEIFHLSQTGLEDNLLRFRTMQKWIETVMISWRKHPEKITFRTSGSKGAAKPCTHSMLSLIQEVQFLSGIFADRKRIVSMVPSHHIYGFLFAILLPRYMNIEVMEGRDMGVGNLASALRSDDLIISFPLHWSYLKKSLKSWPAGLQGVTSSGPARRKLIRSLCSSGIDRITEVFGSSETGGIGYRHDPDKPYTLFSHWRKPELPSSEISRLIRILPEGQGMQSIRIPDILQWRTADTFIPAGRCDGSVQIGGINVFPDRVAEKIRTHPLVKDCIVRLMKTEGEHRLKAFIIPASGSDKQYLSNRLRHWLAMNFPPAERPVSLLFGEILPVTSMGKASDWEIEDGIENYANGDDD